MHFKDFAEHTYPHDVMVKYGMFPGKNGVCKYCFMPTDHSSF